ncbi:MAG: hypothetical protein J6Z06_05315 [Lachnospiraceae bacterium]|nr:hypothetical protein [Lachnospiraceae bacterium]
MLTGTEIIELVKQFLTPQVIVWLILCAIVYGVLHFVMSRFGVFGEGKRKLKEAKEHGRKLTGFIDGHTQELHNEGITIPGTKVRLHCYRYRYTHPYSKEMCRYYLWQRSNCVGAQIALYYDENGRVFHSATDATPLAPLWRAIYTAVPAVVMALIGRAIGWL